MTALRDHLGRFVKAVPPGAPDLPAAMRASGVPGALGCDPPAGPITVCGVLWLPEDAGRLQSPIGLRLAMEWAAAGKAGGEPDEAA